MKNIIALFTTFLFLFSGFISCNYGQESAGPYTLKMRLKPGDTFKQIMDMKMSISSNNSNTNMGMQEGAGFEVMADTVNTLLKITYTHLLAKMDGVQLGSLEEMDSLSQQFNERLKGKSVIVKLGPGNKIIEVTGLDENFPDSLAGPGDEDIKALFSKEELNNAFGMMLSVYPEKPVKIGESWNAVTNMGMAGLNMLVNRRFTLQSVKDGIATITFDGKLADNAVTKQSGLPFSITLNGTHNGTIQINMEDGYMRKADFKLDAKGEEKEETAGRKIPIIIKTEGTLKGK